MAIETSLSGINLGFTRLGVTAHNLANLSTRGFSEYRTQAAEQPAGQGVRLSGVERSEPPPSPEAPAQVDLAAQMVEMISAQRGMEANVQMIRAEDQAERSLLDAVDG